MFIYQMYNFFIFYTSVESAADVLDIVKTVEKLTFKQHMST